MADSRSNTPREQLWDIKAKVDPLLGLDSEKASDDPATWHIVDLAEAVDDVCDLLLSTGLLDQAGHEGGGEKVASGSTAPSDTAMTGNEPAGQVATVPQPPPEAVEQAANQLETAVSLALSREGPDWDAGIVAARSRLLALYRARADGEGYEGRYQGRSAINGAAMIQSADADKPIPDWPSGTPVTVCRTVTRRRAAAEGESNG